MWIGEKHRSPSAKTANTAEHYMEYAIFDYGVLSDEKDTKVSRLSKFRFPLS